MNFAELVDLVRVEEQTLGERGLARVNMGDDADVADGGVDVVFLHEFNRIVQEKVEVR